MSSTQLVSANPKSLDRGGEHHLDRHRKQLMWLAMSLVGLLGLAFVLVVAYGEEYAVADFNESLLLIGLLAFLTCTVAYFADKERAQRVENRNLLRELHQTAQALDARVNRLNKLCDTSTHLAGTLNIERISELVVEALVAQVEADAASLVLLDKAKGDCLYTHSQGTLAELQPEGDMPEAIAKAAVEEGGPALRSLESAPDVAQQLQAWGNVRAAISAPMRVSDIVGGELAAMRHNSFSPEDLNLLTTLANMASKAIEAAELHEELRQSYFRTLHVLARSLAARDPYSAAHGEAVARVACLLAERLGLEAEAIKALLAYGPLHDLGKIGIADAVLLKEGPLTQEEIEMCRQHAAIGEEIMRPLNPGPAVLCMIRNHHERWDGDGYPDRLRGEETHILARVLAVADAFHAMVSHRPYRPGAVVFRAVQEIKALAGTQFDPRVVEVMVELWDSGEVAKFNIAPAERSETGEILSRSLLLCAPPPVTR
ncbi:MAG TPA: HD domain-containing phosphohydrolase [Armatimonadota bacterium]|nr:HD domain-containing phosphohydrolase [Armatimonadota bacterium]